MMGVASRCSTASAACSVGDFGPRDAGLTAVPDLTFGGGQYLPEEARAVTRRRLLLEVGVVALLGVGGLLLSSRPGAGITPENYDRIEEGMALSEVEAILGDPPDDYTWGPAEPCFNTVSGDPTYNVWVRGTIHEWRDPHATIRVVVDRRDGTVLDKDCTEPTHREPFFLVRLRRLLPW
jgi:hypothetical protein